MRWGIIKGPSRLYFRDNMQDTTIIYACIILHKMIIEDKRAHATDWTLDEDEASSSTGSRNQRVSQGPKDSFRDYVC